MVPSMKRTRIPVRLPLTYVRTTRVAPYRQIFFPKNDKKHIPKKPQKIELDIPGMDNVFKKELPISMRVVWMVTIIICIVLSLYQIICSAKSYLAYPVQTNLDIVIQTDLALPTITICPSKLLGYVYPEEDEVKQQWPPRDSDWSNETFQFHLRHYNISAKIKFPDSDQSVTINDTEISTFFGICRLLSYGPPIPYQGRPTKFGIKMTIPDDHEEKNNPSPGNSNEYAVKFMLEDKADYPLPKFFLRSRGPLKKGLQYEFELTSTTFYRKSFPNNPCEDDIKAYIKCWNTFVSKELNKTAKCRLPFITSDQVNETLCSDYRTTIEAYKNISKLYKLLLDPQNTDCLEICDNVQYHLTKLADVKLPSSSGKHKQILVIWLDLSENLKHTVTRVTGYTLEQLVSDIGGSLGLFLGCSILSLLEVFQYIGFRISGAIKR